MQTKKATNHAELILTNSTKEALNMKKADNIKESINETAELSPKTFVFASSA